MKLAALFSGGKDSVYAMHKAGKEGNEIVCLVSLKSENPESYMFHVPNIELVKFQAQALDLPLIFKETKGEKEIELADLKAAIQEAKEKYAVEGVVAGAIASDYQHKRVKKICDELGLRLHSPIWHINHEDYMRKLVAEGFEAIITGIAAEGLTKDFLGKKIDDEMIEKLMALNKKVGISICGEGGEYESLVLNCPMFKKRLKVLDEDTEIVMDSENSGVYAVKKAELI